MSSIYYHYTSPQGAFDILHNKKLWFTDCQYLNDMSEFIYLLEPLKKAYEKISLERNESIERLKPFLSSFFRSPYEEFDINNIIQHNRKGIKKGFLSKYHYYVLCTSSKSDTASMWNYYVKNGAYYGYNLGLEKNEIFDWFSNQGSNYIKLIAGEVKYDQKVQVKMIYDKLKVLFDRYDQMIQKVNHEDDTQVIDEFQDELYEYINNQKLFFKSPSFESEKEFRFVLKINDDYLNNNDSLNLKYRVGASGIITPYIEWHFGNLKSKILKQITLSPMIEPELAKASFKRFLANDVYQNIKIEPSKIKLRF